MNNKKILVISGGTSGIGASTVEIFLDNGYEVYNLDINQPKLNHANLYHLHTDISKECGIATSISILSSKVKHVDALIINAGKHLSANIENTKTDQLYDILNLNLLGAYWTIQSVIPLMKHNGGSIITIGSDQSSVAKSNSTVYGMTKAALLQLTKSIAIDYAKHNIRANCLGVGTVDTPLYRNAIQKYSDKSGIALEDIEKDEANEQPIGRIGRPEEVASLAYFLTLPEASYITGALLPIDGGYIAR